MNCKNCNNSLRTDYSFCPNCGSKVIRNRLTAKSLTYDFIERYFNLDNTFIKTLWHMLKKPELVSGGYISGIRKKYLNPISMLAISLTLSGFIIFLMKKIAWKGIDFSKISYAQTGSGGAGTEKIMSSAMEYGSLLFLFYIPILACASYFIFNKKQYNYAEHTVTSIYALTSFSIISSVYAIMALIINPQFYLEAVLAYSFVMVMYCAYVSFRNSQNSLKSLFWRLPLFLFVFVIGYFGISLATVLILFVTGEVSIQDFMPSK